MKKRLLALLLATLMLVTIMAGCQKTQDVWESYSTVQTVVVNKGEANDDGDEVEDGDQADNGDTAKTNKTGNTKRTKKTTTTTAKNNQPSVGNGPKVTRTTRGKADALSYKPIEDKGADYTVKGTVSIAVDTVRPTDYDAMFDVLQQLYPNVTFEFDFWAHGSADNGSEYLATRMNTGTAANIIWDEAGSMPTYISQGWVKPITKYVAADPTASDIPDNLLSDYTFFGEVFALPHQATFGTVAFNQNLLEKLSAELPGLEWSMDEYEDYLRLGGTGFKNGICVGAGDIHESHSRVCFYESNATGGNYGSWGYNYSTKKIEEKYTKLGATTMRAWRLIDGAEGWYQSIQSQGGKTLLDAQLGISNWQDTWSYGKALMEETLTAYVENWDSLTFDWIQWTSPNKDGNLSMHVDHCFITESTPSDRMNACYQVLRFMTFSTNGNLARLTMYEDSQKGKYNLNSHVYYPTTENKTVIAKFNALSCTDKVDEYLVANIPNSRRVDTFKLVPEFNDLKSKYIDQAVNDVTDGLDPSGAGLNEATNKFNTAMAQAWKDFEAAFKKEYK